MGNNLARAQSSSAALSASTFAHKSLQLAAGGITTQAETKRWWLSVLRIASGPHALALADQVVVSGTSFLTTIIIGRWLHPSELGAYSLGISVVVSWVTIQEWMISLPYTIYRHQPLGTAAEHAGSSLAQSSLLLAVAIGVVLVAALGLSVGGAPAGLTAVIWALIVLTPFALLREFSRRFAFAHLRMAESLSLDVGVAAVQLAGIGWLTWTGHLSAATACIAIGVACAVASVAWLYFARENFAIRWEQLWPSTEQSWRLGKWLLASQINSLMQGYIAYWLLGWFYGMTTIGVYTACMTVVSFANPLIFGFFNVLAPKAASAFSEGGGTRLWRESIRGLLLILMGMMIFYALVLLAGADLMHLLFIHEAYEGHGHTISVLAAAVLASAVGTPATTALTAMERSRMIFWCGLLALFVTMIVVGCLVVQWGIVGAAYGVLAGSVVGSIGRWVAFSVLLRDCSSRAHPTGVDVNSRSAPVIQVMEQFTQRARGCCNWIVEQVGQGAEGCIFAVRSQDQQPIWQRYRNLAIKLFKPAVSDVEPVHAQLDFLYRMHAVLNGLNINGWEISTPLPVFVCASPPALVMTMVPGRTLTSCLKVRDEAAARGLQSVPGTIVAAMERSWSMGLSHGDLNFDNIICEVMTKRLAFIDMSMSLDPEVLCNDTRKRFHCASRDLGYMLFDTAVRVKSTVGNRSARLRQRRFTEAVLRAFIETSVPSEEKQWLLDQIGANARAHLKRLELSWSARGLWNILVRQIASRRIDRLLARVGSRECS